MENHESSPKYISKTEMGPKKVLLLRVNAQLLSRRIDHAYR
jgi:hypothetical protein